MVSMCPGVWVFTCERYISGVYSICSWSQNFKICHPKDIADGDWARADLQPLLDLLQEAVMQGKFHPDPLVPMQIQPSREVFERVKLHWLQSQNNGILMVGR